MKNEHLSPARWNKLQELLALAMVPALLVDDEAAVGAAYDAAANALAGIGIMPEGMGEEATVPALMLAA